MDWSSSASRSPVKFCNISRKSINASFSVAVATATEKEALIDLRDMLRNFTGDRDAEELQSIVFACGRDKFDPLRDWFKALYQVLLGADQGPRFGGFIALYGVEETVDLIEKALDGVFVKD